VSTAIRQRRSTLFVGALALGELAPALASGADIVCIDLEDAVPPGRKDEARAAVVAMLKNVAAPRGVQIIARVNGLRSLAGVEDASALLREPRIGGLLLPKVESADEVRWAAALADDAGRETELYAIIETADGLEHCRAIAAANPRLKALFFGAFDLSTALGCANEWEPLLYARSRAVHAAAAANIEVIDSPFPGVDDLEGLRAACMQVKALGMSGKAAKHAKQIATIREAFTPTRTEIERARSIVAKFRDDPTQPLVHEGKLIELPVIKRLERLAALEP
jgi:(S)-citramalyl-CoA lyase